MYNIGPWRKPMTVKLVKSVSSAKILHSGHDRKKGKKAPWTMFSRLESFANHFQLGEVERLEEPQKMHSACPQKVYSPRKSLAKQFSLEFRNFFSEFFYLRKVDRAFSTYICRYRTLNKARIFGLNDTRLLPGILIAWAVVIPVQGSMLRF
jgi:hypothetical protein